MFLCDLKIKNFRCFEDKNIKFDKQFSIIIGDNGSGKSSIIEAVHYLCYMKSFRTKILSDLQHHSSDSFFLKGQFLSELNEDHSIQVGYSNKKKIIKLDGKAISGYKEIFKQFQVLTILEDDIDIVKGYPASRRSFIDHAILLIDPSSLLLYKEFKKIVTSRNALLAKSFIDQLELNIWTEKLWELSIKIQNARRETLIKIEKQINLDLQKYFNSVYSISIAYDEKYKYKYKSFQDFVSKNPELIQKEKLMKRSFFGAHLDDFTISIKEQKARSFASRGQQKLISLLFKLSLLELTKKNDLQPILLIDDFIADFDKERLGQLIDLFSAHSNQAIITIPFYNDELNEMFQRVDSELLSIKKADLNS